MKHKVFISPSDQVKNTYAAGDTNEAVVCGKIGAACQTALERCGFETMLVQYETMASKCAKSDAFGAELHLPVHTNAYNGEVSGTRLMSLNLTGEGYKACKAIFDVLAPLTPGTSENISAHPELYEIKNPSAPTAYVEADFHDVPTVAQWLIDHTDEVGEAIAHGVCNYFGVEYVEAKTAGTVADERYHKLEDVPEWAQSAIKALMDAGALKGDDTGDIDLSKDMMRTLIISKRYADTLEK